VLSYCNYCKHELFDGIKTTQDFFDKLDKTQINSKNIEVDIFGYVKDKEKISKQYREKKDYTCESCGIKPANILEKRYWHTHHKDGNKTNNSESNLQCLCVLCHSYKDIRHEENFDTKRMKTELDYFVKQYKNELIKINNPYLVKYNK
jgi:hypothetical protein